MFNRTDETEAVVAVGERYYLAMVEADGAVLRAVFHPKASIIGHFDGALEFSSLEEFIATTPDAKTGAGPFDYRVDGLTLLGDTAVLTLGGYSYACWITDHLSLLKIDGNWQIVAKTFFAHPTA